MILISKTYNIVTQESDEEGDVVDSGFIFEDSPFSFRELVEAMRGFWNVSCYPARGETYEYLSCEPETDLRTGEQETRTIHYSRANPARNAKYWRKAMRAAKII